MRFTLQKRKASGKDFSFHKSHDLGAITLPQELLFLSPIVDQDQEDCTAYSSVAVRYNETNNTTFNPAIFWSEELAFAGVQSSNGFDIEVPLATAVEKGFPTNNPSSYIWVTAGGGNDLFTNCLYAMTMYQRPLLGGMTWMNEYTSAPNGIINALGVSPLGGHCIKIAGFTMINGIMYIVLQQSWGQTYGVQGLYYITQSVFNTAFSQYGVAYWSDSQNVTIKTLGLINALYVNIKTLLNL